jgi:hypothetical protein
LAAFCCLLKSPGCDDDAAAAVAAALAKVMEKQPVRVSFAAGPRKPSNVSTARRTSLHLGPNPALTTAVTSRLMC